MGIRIVLGDDHKIVRDGLRSLIEQQGMTVVGEAQDGRSAVQLARKICPDLIIMDVGMPGMNGIEATRRILSENRAIRVIALSMHSDKRFVARMLEAGAMGYLLKDCAFEELATAIKSVLAEKVYLSPGITGAVVRDYLQLASEAERSGLALLTGREREVLQLLAEGLGVREIASCLHISIKTVETHRSQIMNKLGFQNLADLIKFAIREGVTSLER